MARSANDLFMDAALDYVIDNSAQICLCSAQPTTRTEAISTYKLAIGALRSGQFSKDDGDASGRKATVAAQSGLTIDASGTATHVAIVSASDLLYVTVCTSTAVSAGGTADIGAWDIEVGDPTA